MQPRISLIIAVKNAESTLGRCLRSIALQGHSNLELIIVDGLSIDRTPEIIQRWQALISQSINSQDKGIYDAWNKGLELASGEWICFLGADDVLLPGALHGYTLHAQLSVNRGLEFISSRAIVFDPDSLRERVIGRPWEWKSLRRYMGVIHIGSFHHRRLFDRVGVFDPTARIVGDYAFLLRAGPVLRARFYAATTVRIQSDGLSRRSYGVLEETMQTRKKILAMPRYVLLPQYYLDTVKFVLRRLLGVP